MIAVIDYGAGNLRNVCKSLEHVGANILLTDKSSEIEQAEKVVLPGVGAFADCWQGLQKRDLLEPLMDFAQSGRPFLGICVGMQLLFDAGLEMGEWPGLGLIPGKVVKFKWADAEREAMGVKRRAMESQGSGSEHLAPQLGSQDLALRALPVPHIGWNQIEAAQLSHPIMRDIQPGGYAYFVHSFHADQMQAAHIIATTHYGYDFPAVVARDNVWGIQFHPEKSQDVGLQMLKNFIQI